jgi:hypothetical protein
MNGRLFMSNSKREQLHDHWRGNLTIYRRVVVRDHVLTHTPATDSIWWWMQMQMGEAPGRCGNSTGANVSMCGCACGWPGLGRDKTCEPRAIGCPVPSLVLRSTGLASDWCKIGKWHSPAESLSTPSEGGDVMILFLERSNAKRQ